MVARDRDAKRLRPHTQEEICQNKKADLHVASVPGGSLILALVSAASSGFNLSASHRDKQIHYDERGKSTIMGALVPGRHPSSWCYHAVSVAVQVTGFLKRYFPSFFLLIQSHRSERGQRTDSLVGMPTVRIKGMLGVVSD